MASADEVRVQIGIPVDTNSRAAAGDVDLLRAAIEKSQAAIKDNSQMMRGLRGSSAEVKAAKDQLKAAIEQEKQSLSASTLALIKQGTSLEQLAKQEKKKNEAQKESKAKYDGITDALTRAHPKLGAFRDGLKEVMDVSKDSGGLGVVALGIAGIAAAALAATAAVGGLAYAFGKWVIKGADTYRSLSLIRDASTRTALDSKNLGDQVDRLASKVPTSTAALNDLATSLARARLNGQVTVDAMNAVAQANAAVGDSAGAKIREIIERGKLVNRMFIGWQELNGTGLDVGDVAGALAKRMKVSVSEAQKALFQGRVTLADGAAAMRDAVEKKFGGINLKKMMSLDGLSETFSKITQQLTKDINLEPAAKAVGMFFHAFDQSTETGIAMKKLSTDFGNGIVKLIERGAPLARDFMRELVIGGLKADIAFTKLHISLLDAEYAIKKPLKDAGLLKGLGAAEEKIKTFLIAASPFSANLTVMESGFNTLTGEVKIFTGALDKVEQTLDRLKKATTTGIGGAIVDGILGGMKDNEGKLKGGVAGLADVMKKAFHGEFEINSPSKLTRREVGRPVGEGVMKGIDDTSPDVQQAISDMTKPPRIVGMLGGGAGAGGGSPAASSARSFTSTSRPARSSSREAPAAATAQRERSASPVCSRR